MLHDVTSTVLAILISLIVRPACNLYQSPTNIILTEVVPVAEFLGISQFATLMSNLSQEVSHTYRSINMIRLSIPINVRQKIIHPILCIRHDS